MNIKGKTREELQAQVAYLEAAQRFDAGQISWAREELEHQRLEIKRLREKLTAGNQVDATDVEGVPV